MFLKDITRKPFFVRTGRTYVRTDVQTRVILYAPPIINGGGIKTIKNEGVRVVTRFFPIIKMKELELLQGFSHYGSYLLPWKPEC